MAGAVLELKLWRWQRWSALALLPLVAFHIVFQYFVVGIDNIDYATVSAKMSTGVLLVIDVLLLATALTHGLLGLRAIIVDYARSAAAARRATAAILVFTAAAMLYGLLALGAFL